jgi:hypothetical protein
MSILRITAALNCKFSGVWFRSSATAAEQRARLLKIVLNIQQRGSFSQPFFNSSQN